MNWEKEVLFGFRYQLILIFKPSAYGLIFSETGRIQIYIWAYLNPMTVQDLGACIFLLTGMVFSVVGGKLTFAGAVCGGIVGLLVYRGAGITGIFMLAMFFLSGSSATAWQLKKKQHLGLAEKEGGLRTAWQVIANGGPAAIFGALTWLLPAQTTLLQLIMAGSLASATADTLSSELGSIYGSRFYDILSFKQADAGPNGVVSLEGTLIGVAGAAIIAFVYVTGFGFNVFALLIVAAGAIGNLCDSLLGATLERRNLMGNNAVNFTTNCAGAVSCLLLYFLVK